ncbi:hypothetical protein FNT36_25115 [Hymenobacter setariae]|uniref:Uncharacterized protein n=1 Tax=Hymenobacter setariae TaxID=2594794 RepID=A0A558BJX5_9BACT|nr:hypothetical protein [Hymenobacter setariae]TVT36796.1 hypothetical protein FNT36_25115 [Hymenobacter setariae]
MKATKTTRPALRIPAARLARLPATATARKEAAAAAWEVAAQAREDARQQLLAPTPEFEAAPRLTMLPGGLHWSAQRPVPGVGAKVDVYQGGHRDLVTVLGYCHAAGFLGLVTEPYHPGSAKARRMHPRARCVFAHQLAQAA